MIHKSHQKINSDRPNTGFMVNKTIKKRQRETVKPSGRNGQAVWTARPPAVPAAEAARLPGAPQAFRQRGEMARFLFVQTQILKA